MWPYSEYYFLMKINEAYDSSLGKFLCENMTKFN